MMTKSVVSYLGNKTYPGRTLVLSVSPDAKTATIVYFIMGRSANSQNRIFVDDREVVRTQAFDTSEVADPSLIIYPIYRFLGRTHIFTNGDQTETIYQGLAAGLLPAEALQERDCEPDAPNFTPRISLIAQPEGYSINIIKAAEETGQTSLHFDFHYPYTPGLGHCIHTYYDDGDPLPSYSGEPVMFSHEDNLGRKIWDAINPQLKVSLLEATLDLETSEIINMSLFNKHEVNP
ncbi:IMP cyclohydrolase [Arcanobacterium buesumense]|uniref:Inosine monophosphate cyclohydrolase n=1 Tax=Arcanobacterium buesumense TaxID=2722751 RepID=A0A6H2EJG2_9ACTO|nr:IMP cyclohydrolase [Arcanobacterium buesumense]QJC21705.1 inosine monophosphate cyclohydrolase [Arcanobacterium buesumense]